MQDLRRDAELALDDTIELWVELAPSRARERLAPYLPRVASETLASEVHYTAPPADATTADVDLEAGRVRIGLRRIASGAR